MKKETLNEIIILFYGLSLWKAWELQEFEMMIVIYLLAINVYNMLKQRGHV